MIFVIYWISWNVCLCWYCCFHVVQSSQQNQQCRKIVTQIFRCIFLSAKLVLHCFFVFILSTNLTNVTICGKLYWIFLLILFLCNTFIKKNYFQFFFSYISNETQNFHWNICMWFHFLHGRVNCWTSCVYLNGLYILF